MLKRYAASIAFACALVATSAASHAQSSNVTFASWGGAVQEGEVKGLLADAAKLGVSIRQERHGGWTGIKSYFQSGAKGWDLATMGFARCEAADRMGALQSIDYSVVDRTKIGADLSKANYIGVYNFTFGIGYQKKKYAANPPKNWADFWDVAKFPGRRALTLDGLYALEAGLLADGVAPNDVYATLKTPAGLDRAMRMIEKIKPHVAVWWRSHAQIQELMRNGEVDIALIPNARARTLVEDGADVAFEWNQAFLDQECFMVPKTALNPAGAMKLINAALDPVNQANFAKRVGYGPINTKAFDTGILTPAEIAWMPMAPQNLPKQITADPLWYSSAEADAAYLRYSKAIQ